MKKIILLILDGFGIRKESHGNAILNANMPNYNYLLNNYPHSSLQASGKYVGLEENQMGNSEVGHLSIGAGRLIKQNVAQISDMFKNKELDTNDTYKDLLNYVINNNKPLHLMALISDGGIHSKLSFILNMIDKLYEDGVKEIYVHAITDGRDTDIHSSYKYIKQVKDKLEKYNIGKIVSICGRYYAMDRDKKWNRTKYYSDMLTFGKSVKINDIEFSSQ